MKRIIDPAVPAIPDLRFACVDVRDVASAHVAAMVTPEAKGQRFICIEAEHSMKDIALILNEHPGPRGYKIPTKRLASFFLRFMALFDDTVKLALNDLGTTQKASNERIRTVLHWTARDLRTMTTSKADSMIDYGVVAAKS